MELNIATAPRTTSLHWKQSTITWDELITWMIDPADKKEAGNYILGTLRETRTFHKHDEMTECVGLHRNRDAIVSRDALMLDVDYPSDDFLDNAKELGVQMLIHTTFSSTPEKPRYRVIIPLSRPVSPMEYSSAATTVMETIGADSFDATSPEPERFMYRPAGEHFEFFPFRGPIMEPPKISADILLQSNLMPQSKRNPFELPGVIGAFNRTYADLDHLIETFGLPYIAEGSRWRFQGTHTAPGMSEISPGLWWSDHSTDPAHGHAQTAFDLVRIHLYGSADLTTKDDVALNDRPSSKKALELAESDTQVRQNQLEHDFGPASPVKTLGYDTDSALDDDLARNLADRGLEKKFRYVTHRGWLKWDGKRWLDCDQILLWEPISEEIRTLAEEWFTTGKQAGQINKVKSFLEVPKMKRMIENLRSVLILDAAVLDDRPDLLNVDNGTIDMRTGELLPHRREDYLTKVSTTAYVPGATHPDWEKTLSAMRPDARAWMQLRIGQAATGHRPPDDVMPILQGGGANGKTTFTGAISATLGEHAVFLSERVLFSAANDHPTEMMVLKGARFALLEETPEGVPLNVKRLKDTLGAEEISARLMRQNTEVFEATHSMFLTTNYHPMVTETDEGTWRRLALVEFPYTYLPGAKGENARTPDPHLRTRMERSPTGQREAVLAWIIEGSKSWYAADCLLPAFPATVEENVRLWRNSSDPLHSYLSENIVKDPTSAIKTGDLYEDFSEWLDREGLTEWSDRLFAGRVRKHEGMKALGGEDTRIYPSSKKEKRTMSQRDPLAPPPSGQVRVWAGIRFAS